jgi:hypothetical protein
MKVSLTEAHPDPEVFAPLDLEIPPSQGPAFPAPERTLKLTIVSRYRCGDYSHSIVPEIRFGGRYLEEFTFPIGTRLRVTVKKGTIIIKPDKYQPWLPEEVAREVREASAIANA